MSVLTLVLNLPVPLAVVSGPVTPDGVGNSYSVPSTLRLLPVSIILTRHEVSIVKDQCRLDIRKYSFS